jgi:integrase
VRLLNACPPDLRRLVHAALLTGCRYGELGRLEVGDLNPEAGTLHIREAKGGRPRHVPLDDEALAFLRSLASGRRPGERLLLRADGRAWAMSHQLRPVAEASAAARLDPAASFHALRHTWASHRVMAGAPLVVVAQVLGHADTRMVEKHYGHLAPSFVRDVIRATAPGIGAGEEMDRIAALRLRA